MPFSRGYSWWLVLVIVAILAAGTIYFRSQDTQQPEELPLVENQQNRIPPNLSISQEFDGSATPTPPNTFSTPQAN